MNKVAEQIIAVIEPGKKSVRFGEHADAHVKNLQLTTSSGIADFVKEVTRKLIANRKGGNDDIK